jgi:plasmid stabilization system protein ParE
MKVHWTKTAEEHLGGNPCVYCLGFARTCQTIEKPYRIIYYIKPDQIDILAVIHSARDLPDT